MDVLDNARQRRRELLNEVAKIDAFIAQYQRYASGDTGAAPKPKRDRFTGADPRAVADAAVEIIRQSDRPIQRREIASRLEEIGIPISAKNPAGYVGTQLWRHASDRVHAVKGGGFVASRPALVAVN